MGTYHFHEGCFAAPDGWQDQSMTVFRLPGGANGKESAILLTRDRETPLHDVNQYADAQQDSVRKSFPGFRPLGRAEMEIGGQPGVVVDYQWRANGTVLLRQRQAYVRHGDVTLILTLSGLASDFEQLEPAWSKVVASFRLLERPDEVDDIADEASGALPHVFALSAQTRDLVVHGDTTAACASTDPFEVERGDWAFFASDGRPLQAAFLVPNRRSLLKKEPGRYELMPDLAGC